MTPLYKYAKEYKIGEIFKYKDVYLKVIKEGGCSDCYFYKKDIQEECQIITCIGFMRLDKTPVGFTRIRGLALWGFKIKRWWNNLDD